MIKKLLFFLGIVAVLIAGAIGGGFGKQVGKELVQPSKLTTQEVEQKLIEAAEKTAKQLNKITPIMIDKDTRMDKATVGPGIRFTYHYTLLKYSSHDLNAAWVKEKLRPIVKNSVCNNKDMKKSLQYGEVYSYSYSGNDGFWISDFEIDRKDCGFQKITP